MVDAACDAAGGEAGAIDCARSDGGPTDAPTTTATTATHRADTAMHTLRGELQTSPLALRSLSATFTFDMVPSWLFGIWRLLRADPPLDFAPGVRMEFLRDGRLHYHVDVGGTDQIIALVYRVEGDTLYTDNPAAPHATAVHFAHGAGDVLLLDFGEAVAVFMRELTYAADRLT